MAANIVRKMRRWRELTQAELAEACGVTRQTIANIEKGDYAPSVILALDIAAALGCTVEELFRPADDTSPTPPQSA
ncbi:helix-turn-helix transcriptional regulator [Corynebacterium aquilae]|nr:helix-turn-helix transcriptional regulator [Corynebacterium aquilae]